MQRIFIFTAGLVLAYGLGISWAGKAAPRLPQGRQQSNEMKAQDYLLLPEPPKIVLVGTSITANLSFESKDILNLGLPGDATFTGLEVLARGKQLPEIIVIEGNINDSENVPNHQVLKRGANPSLVEVRRRIPALRVEMTPANLFTHFIGYPVTKLAFRPIRAVAVRIHQRVGFTLAAIYRLAGGSTQLNLSEPDLRALNLKRHAGILGDRPNQQRLDDAAARMHRYIDDFRERGARPVLLMMPLDSSVMDTPRVKMTREFGFAQFPPYQYEWILPDDATYTTVDNIHLDRESTIAFSRYAERRLLEILRDHEAKSTQPR